MTEPSETTSLIAVNGRGNESNESGCRHGTNHTDGNPDKFTYSGRTTVMLCGVFIIFFQFADILRFAPSLQLLELAYCRNYYSKHNPGLIDHAGHVPEHFCKLRDIQEHLSSTRAWLGFVEGLVGLVLVIPYGHLSERKGGCFVAALNLLGYALSSAWILMICFFWKTFPIDLIVVSPMLRAVGGGAPVSSAVILAIVANAAPTSKRSSVFFLMGAAEILTEMIMPVVSTTFLSKGFVYTPIFLGFVFEGLALVAIRKVPLDTGVKHSQVTPVTDIPQNDNQNLPTARVGDADIERPGFLSSMLQEGQILNDAKVVILLGCFALVKVGRPMLEMLVQYMSKRYGWSFARANIVFSVRATGSLILLLIILPGSKQILQYVLRLHTDRADYVLAVTGNIFLIIGPLCMGFASTVSSFFCGLVIFTLGSGFRHSLQSLLSSFVDRERLTRLYTIVALFDGVGSIVWALLVNGGLKQGIHKGDVWIGLPFFIAAGAYSASMIGLLVTGYQKTV